MDLYSPSWYRVAELQPRLRSHVRIHRHHYRGDLWYVLEDRVSRKVHRFNPVAHYLIGLMDGRRTVQEIWDNAITKFGDDAPTQEEMIRLLGQLHSSEVLQTEVTPDLAELMRRAKRSTRKTWLQNLMSPLSIRIPLFDPDSALERWLPWYRPLFGWFGACLWCAVVGTALFAGASHWRELTEDITSHALAPQNLVIMWLTFPVLKLLHEFGHACATKAWGGEVHEMGVMLLVLMPIPYVDASAASAFRQTSHRATVGAAGMIVELFVAAIALLLWLEIEPGIVRAVLYNVMLIAGISTVVFNANPLLRYDGYYILADLIQIPNLRARQPISRAPCGHTAVRPQIAGIRGDHWRAPVVCLLCNRFIRLPNLRGLRDRAVHRHAIFHCRRRAGAVGDCYIGRISAAQGNRLPRAPSQAAAAPGSRARSLRNPARPSYEAVR